MNPYKVVQEDSSHVTFQYRTGYTWFTYAILLTFMLGVFYPSDFQLVLGGISLAIYYAARTFPGRAIESKIRAAMRAHSIEVTGSRVSFSNPMQYKIPK